ncbi:MAG: trigger factor [Dysgonamonadaceae bacterium]|jgi:trigger factor|nr:trigger factor [Dysgonamonadaceae bacterium]
MNLTLNKIDAVNATVTIEVAKTDYQPAVEKSINDLRKKANVPGFRKGMVPSSMIRKMYGKSLLNEEINKLALNRLSEYILEEKLNVLGNALLDETQQPADIDVADNHTVVFSIGLAPEINFTIDKEDVIPYYEIKVPDEMIDRLIENHRANFGEYSTLETVNEKALVRGILTELDDKGNPKTDGVNIENAMLIPAFIKNDDEKNKIIDAKLNTEIVFNPFKAYEGNEAELSSFLKIKKGKVKDHTSDFSLQINNISNYKEAEVNQELFDRVFGKDKVKTVEEFRLKVAESISRQLALQSENKFLADVGAFLKKKAGKVTFPETFLKRFMLQNTKESPEKIEENLPEVIEDLNTRLIKEKIIRDYKIKVEENEIVEAATATISTQLAQYGMTSVSDDVFKEYLKKMLQNEQIINDLVDKLLETKYSGVLKENLTLDYKSVSLEEFQKLVRQEAATTKKKPSKRASKKAINAEEPKES